MESDRVGYTDFVSNKWHYVGKKEKKDRYRMYQTNVFDAGVD